MLAFESGLPRFPRPANEPVREFEPGSAGRSALKRAIADLESAQRENFSIVDGNQVREFESATAT